MPLQTETSACALVPGGCPITLRKPSQFQTHAKLAPKAQQKLLNIGLFDEGRVQSAESDLMERRG